MGYFHKHIRERFREGVSQVLSRLGDAQCCGSSLFYATFVWSCQPGKEVKQLKLNTWYNLWNFIVTSGFVWYTSVFRKKPLPYALLIDIDLTHEVRYEKYKNVFKVINCWSKTAQNTSSMWYDKHIKWFYKILLLFFSWSP